MEETRNFVDNLGVDGRRVLKFIIKCKGYEYMD
jgi:hypothetical protein